MRRLGVLLFAAAVGWTHEGDKKLPPSKAAKDLKRAKKLQKEGKTSEFQELMLACKRTMVKEGRYACCIRGGCNSCAFEMECTCGRNLATKNGKGVCKECYAGWHAGHGAFEGIPLSEVQVSEMGHGDDMSSMMPYLSGTSRRPEAQPIPMTHTKFGDWTLMTMGQGFLAYTMQSTPRGGDKLFGANWIMPMLSHKLGPGTFTFRSMLSFEPGTITQRRYPLLFQTGETAYGRPLADGQHPHDFFTELAVQYSVSVGERTSLNFYGGPRGEPALGPPAYPHRLSALENPIAVLSHHYQDSTHISNNVVTAGITHGRVTFEASGFNGREPDEKRWGLEKGAIDSWSARMTVLPTSRWAIQASGGMLPHGPRVTASAQHIRPLSTGYIASTLVWGQDRSHGLANSYLGESTLRWRKHWVWGRLERTDRDSTLLGEEEPSRIGQVTALTLGYAHDLPRPAPFLTAALGGQIMVFKPSQSLEPLYGSSTPVGAQFFLRVRFDSGR